ncbi:hypothetical protein L3X38_007793 [Prunus dulcis]|uniref:Uncharacterized protein n=1 Tax=Prunus dulcis TaxID=3755 RepID=A0AAD4ZVA2_PRUDU|nr:hypothetical protein L3X38_007793 [Prunus dulcis]
MESGDGDEDGIVIPGPYPTCCHPYPNPNNKPYTELLTRSDCNRLLTVVFGLTISDPFIKRVVFGLTISDLFKISTRHEPDTTRPIATPNTRIHLARGLLGAHWLRSCKNSEVKRVGGWSNPRMGDHPGKLLVSSQKQNRAGSEGGPKRTISCYGGAGLRCDNLVSEPLCRVVRVCRRGRRTLKGSGL